MKKFLRDKAESSYFGPQVSFSGIAGFGARAEA